MKVQLGNKTLKRPITKFYPTGIRLDDKEKPRQGEEGYCEELWMVLKPFIYYIFILTVYLETLCNER